MKIATAVATLVMITTAAATDTINCLAYLAAECVARKVVPHVSQRRSANRRISGEITMRIVNWCAVILVALVPNTKAFELDPSCHEYYQMIQQPGLTYEDVGRIAEAMYHGQCWPAMQGLLEKNAAPAAASGLPSCTDLAAQLEINDSILKIFDARPLQSRDCGMPPDYECSVESIAWRKSDERKRKANLEEYYEEIRHGTQTAHIEEYKRKIQRAAAAIASGIDRDCDPNTSGRVSHLQYEVSAQERFLLTLAQCNALVRDPSTVPDHGPSLFSGAAKALSLPRPVNCRGRVTYTDGTTTLKIPSSYT